MAFTGRCQPSTQELTTRIAELAGVQPRAAYAEMAAVAVETQAPGPGRNTTKARGQVARPGAAYARPSESPVLGSDSQGQVRLGWAPGTGFGSARARLWDIKASETACRSLDSELEPLVQSLSESCRCGKLTWQDLSESCLLPFVRQALRACAFNDVSATARTALPTAVVGFVHAIAHRPDLRPLLFQTATGPSAATQAPALPPGARAKRGRDGGDWGVGGSAPEGPPAKRTRLSLSMADSTAVAAAPALAGPVPAAGSGPGTGGLDTWCGEAGSVVEALSGTARCATTLLAMAQATANQNRKGGRGAGRTGPGVGAGRGHTRGRQGHKQSVKRDELWELVTLARTIVEADATLRFPGGRSAGSVPAASAAAAGAAVARPRFAKRSRGAVSSAHAGTCGYAEAAVSAASPRASSGAGTSRKAPRVCPEATFGAGPDAEIAYESALRPLAFAICDTPFRAHAFAAEGAGNGGAFAARARRVMAEGADMPASLPLTLGSSVLVRVDESRMHLWKGLITGPQGTPYGGGCFVFDVALTEHYPSAPPKVQLLTTGGGTVRFNPNLYESGKVCLSLLGTWHGDNGSVWLPGTSTLLQVFASIQGLIFIPDPYFNEPGRECERGTPTGEVASRHYNRKIREATVRHAILGMLRAPPPEFSEAVRQHFRHRAADILSQVEGWVQEARVEAQATRTSAASSSRDLPHHLSPYSFYERADPEQHAQVLSTLLKDLRKQLAEVTRK